MSDLTIGSLFSGTGGFELGALNLGIKPIWNSEIEPSAIRVTRKRMPNVKHYGNIKNLKGSELEPVDIISGGSPCQDLSVAGKRDGLSGNRSSLFYEQIRIVKEMREKTNGKYPRYMVWENVTGAFSSNNGSDFKRVLEEIISVKEEISIPKPKKWQSAGYIMGDGFSICWRILDSQYFGVPQRRKRIYLVADFARERADKILFEQDSEYGNFKKSKNERKNSAQGSRGSTNKAEQLVYENHGQDVRYKGPLKINGAVTSTYGNGGNNTPFVVDKTYDIRLTSENTKNVRANIYETNTSRTLDTNGNSPASNQGGVAIIKNSSYGISRNTISGSYRKDFGFTIEKEKEPTLVASGAGGVCYSTSRNSHHTKATKEIASTLVATDYKDPPTACINHFVRRLTPTECSRLQGFPDYWCNNLEIENPTNEEIDFYKNVFNEYNAALGKSKKEKSDNQIIKWLKSDIPDTAKYKLWGNGVTLMCVEYVLCGILANHKK